MIRVSSFQTIPKFTFDERKDQILKALEYSDKKQVDFLCFPEGFLTGYYDEYELAKKNSLNVKEKTFQNFLFAISSFKTTIILGFNEKENNRLYNSAAIIERGKILGIQRKHYLYYDYFNHGTSYKSVISKAIKIGVIICLDSNYFEPARLLALQGASIIFCPMCNKVSIKHPFSQRPLYYSHFAARSFENRCWLVTADWYWPKDEKLICPGHSVIYSQDGEEVARSSEFKEEFLIFDISKEILVKDKGLRVYGSNLLQNELDRYKLKNNSYVRKIKSD